MAKKPVAAQSRVAFNVTVPKDLRARMEKYPFNWSKVFEIAVNATIKDYDKK